MGFVKANAPQVLFVMESPDQLTWCRRRRILGFENFVRVSCLADSEAKLLPSI